MTGLLERRRMRRDARAVVRNDPTQDFTAVYLLMQAGNWDDNTDNEPAATAAPTNGESTGPEPDRNLPVEPNDPPAADPQPTEPNDPPATEPNAPETTEPYDPPDTSDSGSYSDSSGSDWSSSDSGGGFDSGGGGFDGGGGGGGDSGGGF